MFKRIIVASALFAALWAVGGVGAPTASAAEATPKTTTANNDNYVYTAQPGDSYTKMARKAIQTYGVNTKTNLSGAQIIFAETNLTIVAGSPELEIGQKVTISKATVKEWVEKAQKLTTEEKAAWQVYVPYVDFNTNDVGEA